MPPKGARGSSADTVLRNAEGNYTSTNWIAKGQPKLAKLVAAKKLNAADEILKKYLEGLGAAVARQKANSRKLVNDRKTKESAVAAVAAAADGETFSRKRVRPCSMSS